MRGECRLSNPNMEDWTTMGRQQQQHSDIFVFTSPEMQFVVVHCYGLVNDFGCIV